MVFGMGHNFKQLIGMGVQKGNFSDSGDSCNCFFYIIVYEQNRGNALLPITIGEY
jgi:hypothetical protein